MIIFPNANLFLIPELYVLLVKHRSGSLPELSLSDMVKSTAGPPN
ncbi:hypothetical protein SAMN05443144_105106 [Fodinibius roseus]|uniref:Uncharacterized protein n=1 Tax=Fodinibius roseus TaxID=1194090 RepID=A0A1M4YME9_9BACT|nr:hypothetical protein SAMN05443144_105106 [Fodinibius roseus]